MEIPSHSHDLGTMMIDRDHQEISELMLEINFNAARDGNPARKIRRLEILSRLMRSHFLLEEGVMSATKYPGLTLHRLRHRWMMEQVRQLATYWNKEKKALTREPMGLLWELHTAHLESEDRMYGLWLGHSNGSRKPEQKQEVELISH